MKINKIYCDRCNREIEEDEKVYAFLLEEVKRQNTDMRIRTWISGEEICQECAEKIAALVTNEDTEKL